mmetsp:Transcript_14053/g.26915  ORF Transcript_14053/g.26915 Transcript_14053/m.26915 type:complete len:245 (+) Transcript_14053:613-1347(+)
MQTNKLGYGFAPHRTALLLNRIFAKTIAGCCHHPCRTYRNWNDTRCSSSKRDITNNDRSEVIPPRSYTQQFGTPTRIVAQSIGVCRSPYMERAGTPHQPSAKGEHMMGETSQEGILQLFPDIVPAQALQDLEGFDFIWCIFYCHLNAMNVDSDTGGNRGWNARVRPPRLSDRKIGTLATRAPHRPNPIGLSALRVLEVNADSREIRVKGLDILDGTPILDIKPYIKHYDAIPSAKAGWLDHLEP